jgi:hypothetical protein
MQVGNVINSVSNVVHYFECETLEDSVRNLVAARGLDACEG